MSQTVNEPTDGEPLEPPHLEAVPETAAEITAFVREVVKDAGADGVVVNLSGGIDSTVTATLATEALGSENVYGLILPADGNTDENIYDARRVAEELVIDYRVLDIQPILDGLVRTVYDESRPSMSNDHMEAVGNATARLRMLIAYFEANTASRLVLGTGNRTELALGYFTKYGDGGVDLLPIGDLYKTEVRELARHLDVHDELIEKEPTAGLWEGQADESELGAAYETIDAILHRVLDRGESVREVARTLDVDTELVRTYVQMNEHAAHKRIPPPTPTSYGR